MKKIVFIVIMFLIVSPSVFAEENRIEAKLIRCDKSESIFLEIGDKTERISLIAYDKSDNSMNKEIDTYICEVLKNATKIEIEIDENSEEKDKYNRKPVWLYVDDLLLQNELIKKGYGQVNYVTGEYKYLNELCETQKTAIENNNGIWSKSGIKEEYCNSGISINQEQKETKKEKKEEQSKLYDNLKYVLFLNSGILLLLNFLIKGRKHGKR